MLCFGLAGMSSQSSSEQPLDILGLSGDALNTSTQSIPCSVSNILYKLRIYPRVHGAHTFETPPSLAHAFILLLPIMQGGVEERDAAHAQIGNQSSIKPCGLRVHYPPTMHAGRALKSVVQSMLMSDPQEKLDPMSLLTYMSAGALCAVCVKHLHWPVAGGGGGGGGGHGLWDGTAWR